MIMQKVKMLVNSPVRELQVNEDIKYGTQTKKALLICVKEDRK